MAHRPTDRRWLGRLYAKIIPLPVVALAGAVLTDWAYLSSMTLQYSNFSGWLLLFALVGGITALLVLALSIRTAGGQWLGTGLLAIGMIVGIVDFMVHMRDGYTAVAPPGIVLTIAAAVIVAVAAWVTRTSAREVRA